MIALRADAQKRGLVRQCVWRAVEFECEVMINGSVQWVAESNLISTSPPDLPDWKPSGSELLRELALTKLDHPLTEALYAYRASRTQHEPYQFRPALKFLRANRNGILIADEVGLGKTIEAAIIYLELKARLDIQRVLILCPSRLTNKWQDELVNRFEEQFDILNADKIKSLSDEFERYGTSVRFRAIASFELFRRRELAERWDSLHVPLDLLIVDEAHYLRNAETQTYKLGVTLSNSADAVVMLSATPLHLRSRDLYNLLHLISPEEYFDPNRFEETIAPNAFINEAIAHVAELEPIRAFDALRKVERTALRQQFIGNPFYRETQSKLISAGKGLTRAQAVAIQRELIELNTIAPVFSRTRKREVVAGAVREPHTIRVEFSAEERALYNAVLGKTQERLALSGSGAVGFAAIMQERQAASCLPELAGSVKDSRLGTQSIL
jgi:SNF2 family DNA or RNA helicase